MSVKIREKSSCLIEICNAYRVVKTIGLLIMTLGIIGGLILMLFNQEQIEKKTSSIIFNATLALLSAAFLTREFYFYHIDKNNSISKTESLVKIDKASFLLQDIQALLIIEYNGIGIMSTGYNLFIKLKNNKRIPIVIRVGLEDVEKVKDALCKFLNVEKIEKKKWLVG
jgi:hypothetical protein